MNPFRRGPKPDRIPTRDEKATIARLYRRERFEASEIAKELRLGVNAVSRYLEQLDEDAGKKEAEARRKDPLGSTLEGIRARAADGLARQVEMDPKLAAQVSKGLQKEMLRELGMESDPDRGDIMGGLFALAKEYRDPITQILMKQFPDTQKEAMLKEAITANQRLAAHNQALMAKLRELAPELFTDQPQPILTQDPPADAPQSEATPEAQPEPPPAADLSSPDMRTKFVIEMMDRWKDQPPEVAARQARALLDSGQIPEAATWLKNNAADIVLLLGQATPVQRLAVGAIGRVEAFLAADAGTLWWNNFASDVARLAPQTEPSANGNGHATVSETAT